MYSKSILFICSSIFFLLWVFINNIFNNLFYVLFVLLLLVVLFLLYYILTKKHVIILLACLIFFLVWWLISYNQTIQNNEKQILISPYYNKNVELILKIQNIEKINESNIEYKAKLEKIWTKQIKQNIYSLIKVWKSTKLEKNYIIKSNSKILEIKDFNNFSYKNYLLSKNIFFKSSINNLEVLEKKKLNVIERNILDFRKSFLDAIYNIYPKNEAVFLGGILLWARESLDKDLKQNFNNSWLTHFIAVSWFNITIIIIFLSFIFKYLPVSLRTVLITISIIFFTILVWDTAPVIRASIMWLVWYYILNSWRKWNSLSIILFTVSIMVILSPLSLNFDVSLHLSFLAVLWIIYTQKYFEKVFSFLPNFLEIKTAFCLTLSALVFTLPIMIFNFWQVSILAPLANIAVSWTIPIAMSLWFLSVIVYFVYSTIGIHIWYFTRIFLKWDILMVNFFWKQDWAIINFNFNLFKYHFELLYFVILLFLIFYFKNEKEQA